MSYEELLNDTIYTMTAVSSQNAFGEWIFSYSQNSSEACRMNPITQSESVRLTGKYENIKWKCFLLSSSSISTGDHVIYNGSEYRVQESYFDSSHHHKIAYLGIESD